MFNATRRAPSTSPLPPLASPPCALERSACASRAGAPAAVAPAAGAPAAGAPAAVAPPAVARVGLRDRLIARPARIVLGIASQLAGVLHGLALDVRGSRLGRLQDALDLAAGGGRQRRLGAARMLAAELLHLCRERAQMRVHRG